MSKSREEFIQMLVDIDEYLNSDKEKDSIRVVNQVKAGLHTSSELIVWIRSVKSKYVITQSMKISGFGLIFGSLVFGSSMFLFDMTSDCIVNRDWRSFASTESPGFPCEVNNITYSIETSIHEIVKNCGNTTDSNTDLLNCVFEGQDLLGEESDSCFLEKERSRFSSAEWLTLSNITLFHILFPWILFAVSFFLLNFSQKKYEGVCGRVMLIFGIILSPITTKWNVFLEKVKITELFSTTPATVSRKKIIKGLETTISTPEDLTSIFNKKDNTKERLEDMNEEEFVNWLKRETETFLSEKTTTENKPEDTTSIYNRKFNVKERLKDMNEEEFVDWIKIERKRETTKNQDKNVKSISLSKDVLLSWMKWKKNLDIVKAQDKLYFKIKQETLNLAIEVAAEASLHFFIQVLLILPDIILSCFKSYSKSSYLETAKGLVNWKMLSILSSFATMANSYSRIKVLEKANALSWSGNPGSLFLMLIFTTLSTICRTIIFGCFVYFTNPDGHFEIWKAIGVYYAHVLIMLFFNIIFNSCSPSFSGRYIISMILNSRTSFYSYNYYNFVDLKNDATIKHKPSFLRQLFYFIIIICENVALTIYFVLYSSSYNIEDSHGVVHLLSTNQVITIVIFIIILQCVSVIFNLIYYDSHPASVSLIDLKGKMKIDILGTSWGWKSGRWTREKRKEENTNLEMDEL